MTTTGPPARITTVDPPLYLALPLAEPATVPGCEACKTLDEQRAAARTTGDYSTATDCNVRIRTHHQGAA